MDRVHGSRRDPRKDEYGKISRRYRRHNWKDCHLESNPVIVGVVKERISQGAVFHVWIGFWWRWRVWRWGFLSTLPRPRARRRQYPGSWRADEHSDGGSGELSGDDLARFHGLVLPWSRGFGDGVWRSKNAEMGLRKIEVWRCSVPLMARDLSSVISPRSWLKRPPPLSPRVLLSRKGPRPHPVRGFWMMGPRESRSPNRLKPKKARTDTGVSGASAKPPVASGAGSSAHRTLGEALGPRASVMASAATAKKILAGVILPADKEKVDKLTFDQVVTKFIHALGQWSTMKHDEVGVYACTMYPLSVDMSMVERLAKSRIKFAPASETDKQLLQRFCDACKGIPQVLHTNFPFNHPVPVSPATTPSSTEDVELAMAINASIQSAMEARPPYVDADHSSGSKASSNSQSGWGTLAAPAAQTTSSGCEIQEVGPGGNPTQQIQNQSDIPATTVQTAPSLPTPASLPSAPPVENLVIYDGPIQYPLVDFSPIDMPSQVVENLPGREDERKEDMDASSSSSCVICLDAPVEGACIPCGHMAGCMLCLSEIKDKKWGCPVCRAKIDQVIRLYAV
ncbi:hypothetical protein Acr_24g0004630 [Actinidia rufa]|uniref:RING-type domain-containing protein n=1 Tax=Actinidia rufa TaxID=165716 RepID=A0A7J0GU03_9ERIC|nr:hypothetical protein Acr_24g0004630 [Actinidia rufa]